MAKLDCESGQRGKVKQIEILGGTILEIPQLTSYYNYMMVLEADVFRSPDFLGFGVKCQLILG